MKNMILITLFLSGTAFAKSDAPNEKLLVKTTSANVKLENSMPQEIKVGVEGMVCAFCAQGIEKSFMKLPEISKVEVSLEKKYVILKFKDGLSLPKEKIAEVLKEAGYESVFGQ